ncbi:MAG: hypothetical protein NUV85_03100, partial [Candidatus Berkelbacteria bacterium]|nr:hypothetical protein [Candidatus Berkelbacteria bacterium]
MIFNKILCVSLQNRLSLTTEGEPCFAGSAEFHIAPYPGSYLELIPVSAMDSDDPRIDIVVQYGCTTPPPHGGQEWVARGIFLGYRSGLRNSVLVVRTRIYGQETDFYMEVPYEGEEETFIPEQVRAWAKRDIERNSDGSCYWPWSSDRES